MKMKLAPIFLAIGLASAACGDTADSSAAAVDGEPISTTAPGDTALPDEPTDVSAISQSDVVFVWTENGGCMQAGPNCARYVVTADGTVNTYRGDSDDIAATGAVDSAALADWMAAVKQTDISALVDRAGPGEMTAAFDGVDFILEAPHADTTLSSVDIEFSRSEDYFVAANALVSSAAQVAPLDIEMR